MTALESISGGLCKRRSLPHKSSEHARDVNFLEIQPPGASPERPVALIVGGVHARELMPPGAVLTFAVQAVTKYASGDADYPKFTDPEGSVPYKRWTILNKDIRR